MWRGRKKHIPSLRHPSWMRSTAGLAGFLETREDDAEARHSVDAARPFRL
jgi:hypothetical protein